MISTLLIGANLLLQTSPVSAWLVQRGKSSFDDSPTVTISRKAATSIAGWPGKSASPVLLIRCKEGGVQSFLHTGLTAQVESGDTRTFRLRFGSEPAIPEELVESSDNAAYFFQNPTRVIGEMLTHDRLLIGFTPFNSAPVDTSFPLSGLRRSIESVLSACPDNARGIRIAGRLYRKPTPAEMRAVLYGLTSNSPEERGTAIDDVRQFGPNAVEAVPALIRDLNAGASKDVLDAIGRIGQGAGAAAAVVEDVGVRQPEFMFLAERTMLEISPGQDVGALRRKWRMRRDAETAGLPNEILDELASPLSSTRREAVMGLKDLAVAGRLVADNVGLIAARLRDEDDAVRLAAVAVLEAMGPVSLPALKAEAEAPESPIRERCQAAIAQINQRWPKQ